MFKKLETFFKETMEIEDSIPVNDFYRLGQGTSRPLLVKLKHPSDKAVIFTNAIKLKEKTNIKKKMYFVHENLLDEQNEMRQFYKDLVKENNTKEKTDQLKIKMQCSQISVNNQIVHPKIQPPGKAKILRMTDQQLDTIKATKLIPGPQHMEKGSEG